MSEIAGQSTSGTTLTEEEIAEAVAGEMAGHDKCQKCGKYFEELYRHYEHVEVHDVCRECFKVHFPPRSVAFGLKANEVVFSDD